MEDESVQNSTYTNLVSAMRANARGLGKNNRDVDHFFNFWMGKCFPDWKEEFRAEIRQAILELRGLDIRRNRKTKRWEIRYEIQAQTGLSESDKGFLRNLQIAPYWAT